jgi:hypothetical protein
MEKKKTTFDKQDAPLKNTDRAFVKVSKDGSPDLSGNRDRSMDPSTHERAIEREHQERPSYPEGQNI